MVSRVRRQNQTETQNPAQRARAMLAQARRALATPAQLDQLLAKLGAREQSVVQRHLETCEQREPARARLWRRLACALFTLAPYPPKATQDSLFFYIPDGRYRMQVFALHDAVTQGAVIVYCANILEEAMAAGLLAERQAPTGGGAASYRIRSSPSQSLMIDALDAKTENLPAYCKDLTGWNRKALRITLPVAASDDEIETAELLCAMTAQKWAVTAASEPA